MPTSSRTTARGLPKSDWQPPSLGFAHRATLHASDTIHSQGTIHSHGKRVCQPQERALPFDTPEETSRRAQAIPAQFLGDDYPHLAELTIEHVLQPGYDHGSQYGIGLDLILDSSNRPAKPLTRRPNRQTDTRRSSF